MKAFQLSLFTDARVILQVAGLVKALKASMWTVANDAHMSRDQIVDAMNGITRAAGMQLTSGRAKQIHKDTLKKWLNPEEADHVPGLLAIYVFCLATGRNDPFAVCLSALGGGVEVMTDEDRYYRDVGKSFLEKQEAAQRHNEIIRRRLMK